MAEVTTVETLPHMQGFGVRMPGHVEPGSIVESGGVDDQRVALPLPDRIAAPGWFRRRPAPPERSEAGRDAAELPDATF